MSGKAGMDRPLPFEKLKKIKKLKAQLKKPRSNFINLFDQTFYLPR